MEIKSSEIENDMPINILKKEIVKRDNIIKLLTGVIEVIKSDVNIKTHQLDYLINQLKNHNYESFDYSTCIRSLDKLLPPVNHSLNSSGVDLNFKILDHTTINFSIQSDIKKKEHDITSQKFKNLNRIIFSYLNFRDVLNLSLTCKSLNQITKENEIWRSLYFKDHDLFLFFDDKDKCIVEYNAKTKYEYDINKDDNNSKYKKINFKQKYLELKRLNKNWEENRPVITTISTSECVTCLNLDTNSNELIYSSIDSSAALYRLYSYRKIASDEEIYMQHHKQTRICDKLSTFYGHGGPIWCIERHEDTLFTGSYDKTIKLWDIKSGHCISTMRNHNSWVSSIQYDPIYDVLISGSWDCTIRLWNMKLLQNSLTLNSQNGNFVHCVRSNLSSNEVIAGTEFKTVDIWDVDKRVKTNVLYGHLERITNLRYVNGNRNMILTGSEDKQARMWDKRSGNCEILFTGHSRGITQVEIDMSNNRVFTASIDKSIKIWDIRKNKEVRTLVGHSSSVNSIAYDQTKLISGSKDNSIRIWNFLY